MVFARDRLGSCGLLACSRSFTALLLTLAAGLFASFPFLFLLEAFFFLFLLFFFSLFLFLGLFQGLCFLALLLLCTALCQAFFLFQGLLMLACRAAPFLLAHHRRVVQVGHLVIGIHGINVLLGNGATVTRLAARGLGRHVFLFCLVLFAQRLVVTCRLGNAHVVGAVVERLALDADAEFVLLVAEFLPIGASGDMPVTHGLDVVITGHQPVDHVLDFLAVQPFRGIQEIGNLALGTLLLHVGSTGHIVILKVVAAHKGFADHLVHVPFPFGCLLRGLCPYRQRHARQYSQYDALDSHRLRNNLVAGDKIKQLF